MTNNRATTLIELAVAMVLASFMLAACYGIYSVNNQSWYARSMVVGLQDQARLALYEISNGMRSAGNEAATIRTRVSYIVTNGKIVCPQIVYQVPLQASGYDVGAATWGAVIPGNLGVGAVNAVAVNNAMTWIHRSANANGTGDICVGRFLVEQVVDNWSPPAWEAAPNPPAWTTVGRPHGTLVNPPGTGNILFTRVLTSNLDTAAEASNPFIPAVVVQAFRSDGVTEVFWPPGIDQDWTDKVQQLRIRLRLRQTDVFRRQSSLEQVAVIQLRNRYKKP